LGLAHYTAGGLLNLIFLPVFRLITAEIAIMFATVFVGSWLSTVAPPNRVVESTPAILITGIAMPEAPNQLVYYLHMMLMV